MPIEITWFDDEKTIILGRFVGEWTWEDYSAAGAEVMKLSYDMEYRIDQIIDMTASGAIPHGPALTYIDRNYRYANFKNAGITVFVGANAILHGLMSALAITNPKRSPRLFTNSIEEAYAMIQDDRAKYQESSSKS